MKYTDFIAVKIEDFHLKVFYYFVVFLLKTLTLGTGTCHYENLPMQ